MYAWPCTVTGRTMVRPVSRRPLTAEVLYRHQTSIFMIGKMAQDFFSEYFCFPLSLSFHQCCILIQLSRTLYIKPQQLTASLNTGPNSTNITSNNSSSQDAFH
jgi:hypothetical protein